MARLAHYASKNPDSNEEYVVIITDGDTEDHCKPGYELVQVVEIGRDKEFSTFPCDRPLVAEN